MNKKSENRRDGINSENIDSINFSFILPPTIIFGCKSIEKIREPVEGFGSKSTLIVTSNGMLKRDGFIKLMSILENANLPFQIWNEINPEPSIDEELSCLEFANRSGCDIVIGIGGGSVLDVAKKVGMDARIPKIMIPTTAGTGSEVTHESVLKVNGKKRAFVDKKLTPDVAIVDPELMKTMPAKLTAISGIDALAHAIECYDSRKSNFLIKTIAFGAYRLMKDNLGNAVEGDENAIENMALGSLMAGMAFGNSGTALAHALSYPLSNEGITHGKAVAMVLPYALEFNGFDPKIINEVKEIIKGLKLVRNVKWDIKEMARTVMEDKKHLSNNPRHVTYEDIVNIYEKVRGKE